MVNADDRAFVGRLLDQYAINAWRMGVAAVDPMGAGVPPEMQVGEVDSDGWVEWRVLPSTLLESDVAALEAEFGVQFPPVFRAYLVSRFHLFDEVRSRRHDQQIFMTHSPSGKPLSPLRELMTAWRPLIDAGLIPFAQYGDGWGPICFDSAHRQKDSECRIVWLDHEALVPLGPEICRHRETVLPLLQPLYDSCREFLLDVFGG